MNSLWKPLLGAGAVAALGAALLVEGRTGHLVGVVIAAVACTATVLFVALSAQQTRRVEPSIVIALVGLISFAVGEAVYYALESTTDFVPFPSVADVFYLTAYSVLAYGVARAGFRPDNSNHRPALVLALAVGVGVSVLLWRSFVGDLVTLNGDLASVVSVAYPVLAVAVLVASCYTLLAAEKPRLQPVLVALAGLSWFGADAFYNYELSTNAFAIGGAEDFFWLLTYGLVAAAAVSRINSPSGEHSSEDDLASISL